MIAIVLAVLFIASGMLAAGVVVIGLRGFPAAFSDIRQQLREMGEWREVTVRKTEVNVNASARIFRPDFTVARRLPQSEHDLHVAA
jgi:hypothetical protein